MVMLPGPLKALVWLLGLLFAALPVLSGICLWQMIRCRDQGNEPLSRSWADATRSFVGMTIASWCIGGLGWWGMTWAMAYLDAWRRG